MSSLSPRVGLTVMQDTDFVNASPVTSNSVRLDAITSISQCTSTTRPAAPFDGQWIYETDKQNVRRWSQADGKWYLRGGSGIASAAGLVAQFSDGNAHQIVGGGSGIQIISLHDYNATLQNGHTYKMIEQSWFNLSGAYQQNHGDILFVDFFSVYGIGSNPALSDANSLHYFQEPYQQNINPNRRPYYKVFTLTVPGTSGTSNVFFRSLMRFNFTTGLGFPNTMSLGRPASSFAAKAYIYDLGITGAN